jgi:MraZ protein
LFDFLLFGVVFIMFRGSAPAKIDVKGRLKVPTEFRRALEENYGSEVFVTSVEGDSALVYPLSVWEELEQKLAQAPSSNRGVRRYLERVNHFGQQQRLDGQGRVLIPQILRDRAEMVGDVVVSGRLSQLEVWNRGRFDQKLEAEPFTDEDFKDLEELGI